MGHQSWNIAADTTITLQDARPAEPNTLRRLDAGFFKVRFDRLTQKERAYVIAMACTAQGTWPMRWVNPPRCRQGNDLQSVPQRYRVTVPMFNSDPVRKLVNV
jgi:hypothetical protein